MKSTIFCLLFFISASLSAQSDSVTAVNEIVSFQKKQNEEFKDIRETPLEAKALAKFKGHDFYAPDLQFRTAATLKETSSSSFFSMKTTTSQTQLYRVYGMLIFTIKGKSFEIPVYQSQSLLTTKGYEDYLFFPFTDLTNGKETYDGGRYISLSIPKSGNTIIVDFNQAYNPYCAYSDRYACPLVPLENKMDIRVEAGTKYRAKK